MAAILIREISEITIDQKDHKNWILTYAWVVPTRGAFYVVDEVDIPLGGGGLFPPVWEGSQVLERHVGGLGVGRCATVEGVRAAFPGVLPGGDLG